MARKSTARPELASPGIDGSRIVDGDSTTFDYEYSSVAPLRRAVCKANVLADAGWALTRTPGKRHIAGTLLGTSLTVTIVW